MRQAAWLIQEVVKTEQRLHENNMNDFVIKVHMPKRTMKEFETLVPVRVGSCCTLRGHEVIMDNKDRIEIVKEL